MFSPVFLSALCGFPHCLYCLNLRSILLSCVKAVNLGRNADQGHSACRYARNCERGSRRGIGHEVHRSVPDNCCEQRHRKNARALVMPDGLERIDQDIAEPKFLFAEEQIAGIDGTIGHDAELRGAGRASRLRELGIRRAIWHEARTEDHIGLRPVEPFCCNRYELVKRTLS